MKSYLNVSWTPSTKIPDPAVGLVLVSIIAEGNTRRSAHLNEITPNKIAPNDTLDIKKRIFPRG